MVFISVRVVVISLISMLAFLQHVRVSCFHQRMNPFRINRLQFSTPSEPAGLYGQLRLWRTRTAEEMRKPVYYILSNNIIESITLNKPTTLQQLSLIPGIGPAKLKSFGPKIISIVKNSKDAPESTEVPPAGAISDEKFLEEVTAKVSASAAKKKTKADTSAAGASLRRKRGGIGIMSPEEIASRNVPALSARELNSEQRAIAQLAMNGTNMFITGAAGTGKTFLLKYLIQELVNRHGEHKVAVTAPTGISAIAVGGQTIHSFAGIGLGKGEHSKLIAHVKKEKSAVERWTNCSVLIIDEVSMLDKGLFELLDKLARDIRNVSKPFGGIQLIMVGDFLQLPPVQKDSEKHFCFQSPVWEEAGLKNANGSIVLSKIERQSNPTFIKHLNEVRLGKLTPEFNRLLESCLTKNKPRPSNGIIPTKLYAINKEVDAENNARLAELPGAVYSMVAEDKWKAKPEKNITVNVFRAGLDKMIPEQIDLKVGAQVMLLRNRNFNGHTSSWDQLVNGSRGKIISFEQSVLDGRTIPVVQFDNGVITSVGPVEYLYKGPGGDGAMVREQVPLKLAWAATIHKSQGCTLTCAELLLSSSFDFGQVYVALSRVRGIEGLWLSEPIRPSAVKANPAVLEFYGYSNK